MKLQYSHFKDNFYHNIHNNYTVAVYQPNRYELNSLEEKLLNGQVAELDLNIGVAKMHPKEKRWIKKIGREVAKKNMKILKFQLKRIFIDENGRKDYTFLYKTKKTYIEVSFYLSKDRHSAFMSHFIEYEVNYGLS